MIKFAVICIERASTAKKRKSDRERGDERECVSFCLFCLCKRAVSLSGGGTGKAIKARGRPRGGKR